MATQRVKDAKVAKLNGQKTRLQQRIDKAKQTVAEAQAEQAALETQMQRLDEKITWQNAEPVDEDQGDDE